MNLAPHGGAMRSVQHVADAVRLLAVVSSCASFPYIYPELRLRMILLTVILFTIRAAGAPPAVDALCSTTMMLATWAGAWRWYDHVPHLAELAHYVVPATMGVMLTALLTTRVSLLEARLSTLEAVVVMTGLVIATGTACEAVWEIYEWRAMWSFSSATIATDYPDTMRDLFGGLAGSTVAGMIFAGLRTYNRLRHRPGLALNSPAMPEAADTPNPDSSWG